jgi:hypothetical protein
MRPRNSKLADNKDKKEEKKRKRKKKKRKGIMCIL